MNMRWSSVLGVAALSITLRHSSALAPIATDHEAIDVGAKGDVSVEKARSKSGALMRSAHPGAHSEDEHGPEKHHAHHEHNKEHKHGEKHHQHHEGADTELAHTEPAAKGFSAVDPEKIHANHEHGSKSHVDHDAQEHKDGDEADESHKKSKPHQHKFHHTSVDAEGDSLEEEDSEFLPVLGINNPSDLAYRAMDIMMGIASIIPEDYPFVCICGNDGVCVEPTAAPGGAAGCKMRLGQMAAAPGTTLSVAIALVAIIAAMLN